MEAEPTEGETSYSDIEPKVGPSAESVDICNDYIVYNRAIVRELDAKSSDMEQKRD